MIDVAIVGAGVCGLTLARNLQRAGVDAHLFEAQERLGGRVESVACSTAATSVDLGPTWYWPRTQRLMSELVQELSLRDFPQHDPGQAQLIENAGELAQSLQTGRLHDHACRLSGGMAQLVIALTRELAHDSVHKQHVLRSVRRHGAGVELSFEHLDSTRTVSAKTVVLALPPRLVAQRVQFEPPLDEHVQHALRACCTWMATQAKAALVFDRPRWREHGYSGNAFVQHEQAVLAELYDACEPEHELAALGGFVALSPAERATYRAGLPLLLENQVSQLFGEMHPTEQHYRDWSAQPYVCSELDLEQYVPHAPHPPTAPALLRNPHWEGRLWFAGSETAEQETGYLEGALRAASRVETVLTAERSADNSLPELRAWLLARGRVAVQDYQRRIVANLAHQDSDRATQRALVGATESLLEEALARLRDTGTRAQLGPRERTVFQDVLSTLVSEALTFNQRSCALSNFQQEHRPSEDYLQAIVRDVNAAYVAFEQSAQQLCGGTEATT